MGKDNKKIILNLLHKWRSIIDEETGALSSGDLDHVELLNKKSVSLQAQLDKILADSHAVHMDKEVLDSMQKLHALHSNLIKGLMAGTKKLSEKIGMLRKNKTSLKGYKQQKISAPRFMNERT